jgi:hypothetical protein
MLAAALARDALPPLPDDAPPNPPWWVVAMARKRDRAAHPQAALRILDAWGWLSWLDDDLAQVTGGAQSHRVPTGSVGATPGSAAHRLDVDVDP